MAVLLAMLLALVCPTAEGAVEDGERALVFTAPDTAIGWFNGTLEGDEARQLRIFADEDSDGDVTEAEARDVAQRMVGAGNRHQAWPEVTLDGAQPTEAQMVHVSLDGVAGAADAAGPIQVDRVLAFRWTPDAGADERTFRVQVDAPANGTRWTFHAPSGHAFAADTGLDDVQTGANGTRLEGTSRGPAFTLRLTNATAAPVEPEAGAATNESTNGSTGELTNETALNRSTEEAPAANGTLAGGGEGPATDESEQEPFREQPAAPEPTPVDAEPEEATDGRSIPSTGLVVTLASLGALALALALGKRASDRR